jgi:hypothetical protein
VGFQLGLLGDLAVDMKTTSKKGNNQNPEITPTPIGRGIMSTQPVQPLKRRACGTHFIAKWKDWFERAVEGPQGAMEL